MRFVRNRVPMMSWKRFTISLFSVIAVFSCAEQPSIIKPDERIQSRSPSPALSLSEVLQIKTDTVRDTPSGVSVSLDSPAHVSAGPQNAQTHHPGYRDGQPETDKPAPASAGTDTVRRRPADTDYRLMVRSIKLQNRETAKSETEEEEENRIALNFDSADLNEVIAVIADQIDMKYIIDPGVQGVVTIRTAGGISRERLLSLFQLILEVNGLTAVKDGEFYRITPMVGVSRLPIRLRMQMAGGHDVRKEDFVIQIIPLQYIAAEEMKKLLEPFLSTRGNIISHQGSNTLLVVDNGTNIMKAVKLAEAFDIGLLEKMNHRFFFLKNADVENIVKILREVFAPISDGGKDGVKFIPIKRLNSFLAISADTRTFNKIDHLMLNLDATTEGIEPVIHVYFVKNGTALNLSELLNQVFIGSETTAEIEKQPVPASPAATQKHGVSKTNPLVLDKKKQTETRPTAVPPGAIEDAAAITNHLKGTIKITPDEIRNAIIIEAAPSDYRVIKNLLKTIDVPPRQVLIEATIAEIDYSLITQLGVTWEYVPGSNVGSGLLNFRAAGDTGLTVGIGIENDLRVTLNALERQNKVNILSSPHVLASDNQEARIDVSQEIPIVSAETVVPSSGESIVTTTVQYRDTGVLLAVTPHINERGLVTMNIYQEVSEQAEDVNVVGENYPSFFKRVVQTNLTVQHGQTIVLGGLIRENKSKGSSGLPGLAKMPVIGFIFGQTRDSFDKTELIVLLTPKVIINMNDVDDVTDGFKNKVDSVVKDMYEKRIAR